MAIITTRILGTTSKGQPLTNEEVDQNFINLNDGLKEAIGGFIYVTNVTGGNIQKTYVANTGDNVIESIISDATNVTITAIVEASNKYLPSLTINSNSVALTEIGSRVFQGSATVTMPVSGSKSVTLVSDQQTATIILNKASAGPSILTADIGNFPLYPTQTSGRSGNSVHVTGTMDSGATHIRFVGNDAFNSSSWIAVSGTSFDIVGTISNNSGLQTCTLEAKNSLGTIGTQFITTSVTLDQSIPDISFGTVTYPVGQTALKLSETADINITVNGASETDVVSTTGELAIANHNALISGMVTKTVTRISGSYRDSGTNLKVTAYKASNDTSYELSKLIKIANVPPIVTISQSSSRLVSGGNDGTTVQSHTISINSDQSLNSSFNIDLPASLNFTNGGWSGGWLPSNNNKTWVRTLLIHDDCDKTITPLDFDTINLPFNGALIQTTGITGQLNLGGFVSRTVTLDAFQNEASINVAHIDYSKVDISWSSKSTVTTRAPLNTTTTPLVNQWCLAGTVNVKPTTVRILDTEATGSSSEASTITIEEIV